LRGFSILRAFLGTGEWTERSYIGWAAAKQDKASDKTLCNKHYFKEFNPIFNSIAGLCWVPRIEDGGNWQFDRFAVIRKRSL